MTERANERALYSIFVPRNAWQEARKHVHLVRVLLGVDPDKLSIVISKFNKDDINKGPVARDFLVLALDPTMRNAIVRTMKLQGYLDDLCIHHKYGVTIRERVEKQHKSVLSVLSKYDCHGFVLRACGLLSNPVVNGFEVNGRNSANVIGGISRFKLGVSFTKLDKLSEQLESKIKAPVIISYYSGNKPIHSMLYLGSSKVFGHIVYHKVGWGIGDIYRWGFRFESLGQAFYGYDYFSDNNPQIRVFTPKELQQAFDKWLNKK